jgi:dGTP triphosphohydrolase
MDWKTLLSTKRIGKTLAHDVNHQPPRTEFTRDYDRVVFSSSFRRLQDKTQVFPLAKSDYVRTRLTHSLEVASVGRSLGMLAAEVVRQKDPSLVDVVVPQDVGTIVATACLAHDIGACESHLPKSSQLSRAWQRRRSTPQSRSLRSKPAALRSSAGCLKHSSMPSK